MGKRMLFILVIAIGCSGLQAQDSLYYSVLWKPRLIQREAKVLQEKVYEYSFTNNAVTDSSLIEVNYFDSSGQLTKQETFKNNQKSSELVNYYSGVTLDSSLEVQVFPYDLIVRKYRYDSSGRLSSIMTRRRQDSVIYDYYIYNSLNQPLQIISKKEGGAEYVSSRFNYQSDNLVRTIEHFNEGEKRARSSFIYSYEKKKRKTTRSFGGPGGINMLDCIRTYNESQQLIKLERPSRATITNELDRFQMNRWDEEEIYFYHPNGLLREKQIRRNEKLFKLEKHFIFSKSAIV